VDGKSTDLALGTAIPDHSRPAREIQDREIQDREIQDRRSRTQEIQREKTQLFMTSRWGC
jgi:hypothetical protein